jgi:hypothetical protein
VDYQRVNTWFLLVQREVLKGERVRTREEPVTRVLSRFHVVVLFSLSFRRGGQIRQAHFRVLFSFVKRENQRCNCFFSTVSTVC